jgi:lysophospholipase L1-like esterase
LYAGAVKEAGQQTGVPVADVWTEIWEAAGQDEKSCEKFLYDGLHLNAAGYEVSARRMRPSGELTLPQIVFDSIMKIVADKYPEIHHEKLQTVFTP